MADEVQLKITSKADLKNIKKAEDAIKKLGRSADQAGMKTQQAAKKSESSFQMLGKGIEKVSSTVGKLGAVVADFGIVGLVMNAVNAVKALYEWFEKTRTSAARLDSEVRFKNLKRSIEESSESFAKLNESMERSIQHINRLDALDAKKRQNKYAIEDAQLQAQEEAEIASIGNDPDAQEKETLIRNKYAKIRSNKRLERTNYEREESYQNAMYRADEKEKMAGQFEAGSKADREKFNSLAFELKRYPNNPEKRKEINDKLDKLSASASEKLMKAYRLREDVRYDRQVAELEYGGKDRSAELIAQAETTRLNASSAKAQEKITSNQTQRANESAKKEAAANALASDQAKAQSPAWQISAAEAAIPGMQANYKRQVAESWNVRKNGASADVVAKEAADVQDSIQALNAAVNAIAMMKKDLAALNKKIAAAASRQSVSIDEMPTGD